MNAKSSIEREERRAASPDRRRFLRSAVSAGLALGATSAVAAAPKPLGKAAKVRVGVIGTDGHTDLVLGSIPSLPGVELVAFAKSRPEDDAAAVRRNKAFTDKTRIYEQFEPMLEREELDVVGVFLPYYLNAKASVAAARRGIHIVSEKPLATTLADLAALKEAVAESGVRLTSLMNMRCEPHYRAARQAVRDGLIGEPILLTSQKSYKFGASRPWFYKDLETYGGSIPWAGIHSLDYMRWASGREYVRVSAWHGNKDHLDYPGFQDHAGVLLKLDNGGTAMTNIDYLRPETAPTHSDDRLRIAGSEGVVEVLGVDGRTVLMTASAGPQQLKLPEKVDFFADFLAELAGKGKHLISQQDAFRMTEICLIARNAAESGTWLDIPRPAS